MSEMDFWFYLVAAIAFFIALFMAFRGVLLWYWKIDKIVENQVEQNKLLTEIKKLLEKEN